MLKARKRLTKREIKEDKFVTAYFKTQDYFKQNSKPISYGFFAIVAVIVVSLIFTSQQKQKEAEASIELTRARIEYFANNYSGAIPILKNVIEMYGSTNSGIEATFLIANASYETGNFTDAEKYFNQYIDDGSDDLLKSSALAGVAACLEQQKKYESAAKLFQEAAEKYEDSFLTPENLLNSARCYSLSGKNEIARKLLQKLLDEHSDSNLKNDAEILIAELSS